MSYLSPGTPLYRADQNLLQNLKSIREQIRQFCIQHVNRKVRVETIDGHVYEGTIVDLDNGHLYLSVPVSHELRGFFPGSFPGFYPGDSYYNNVILPLVLYELLVISLLY
jgi:hypothetical protein